MKTRAACNLLALTALLSTFAAAQPPVEDKPETPEAAPPDGYLWGSFLVQPELDLSLVYDSNIFATRTDAVGDAITLLRPSVTVESQWQRHKLEFEAGATAARYHDTGSEDYDDYWADTEGRFDISADTNIFGGLGYSREHEDRASPDATLVGPEPTTFDSRRFHGGIAHSRGRMSTRLGATFEHLDYHDVGPLNNDDRDRDLTGVGLRLNYRLNPRYVLFGQAIRDVRRYDQLFDDNGLDRDSAGMRLAVGFTGVFSNRLSGNAYVGRLSQSYDEPTFSDVNALDFNARLSFRATPRTDLVFDLERTLEETTLDHSPGYLYTSASVEAVHRITPRLRASAGASAARADYQGISREDDLYSAEFGLRYLLTRQLFLAASYRITTRDSNQRQAILNDANIQEIDDYSRQQVFLTIGALLYPVRETARATLPDLDRLPLAARNWRGFFIGGQLAHGSSGFHGNGLRGGSGYDQGEYADEGAGAGLFAGFGHSFGRWYLGLEAEADRTATDVYHRKDKIDSRTLDIERGDSYGLSLRGGHRLAGGDLLYLRLGRVRTEFDTYYTVNDAPQNAVDNGFEQDGTRYGIGADIPAGRNLFVRLDYSHTDYDSFVADMVTDAETLSPAESYFRLGLGWQFGGNEAPTGSAPAMNLAGFYAGALVGHGSLNSHATGTHSDAGGSGGGGSFDFIGDFGHNDGVTGGAFVGWGTNLGRWYGGLELTAEASNADWTHVRDPQGRNFSVEKQDTYGLGLRGGYQLRNGTLIYVHADRLRTRFTTSWSKGGNRDNDVERDDRVHGTRIGIGAELPVTRAVFVRLDYSHTEYDDYGFTTAHARADRMRFDNSDTLFRLGLGARF